MNVLRWDEARLGSLGKRLYRDKGISGKVKAMVKTNEDLSKEIRELKDELRQMRGIVNMLFTIIVESEEEEDDYMPYPGMSSVDDLQLNN